MDRETINTYYKAIAPAMLPHLRNRPLSFKRFPDGPEGESFWEKDAPSFTPAWVKRFPVPRREGGPPIEYVVCNNARTLAWIVGIGGIELHPFLHKIPQIDIATQVVFDLDPGEGADILDCAAVALLLRDALLAIDLQSFAKVSGSKGIQVYVPLNTSATHEMTEAFARLVADQLALAHPEKIVSKMAKALRRKKVFIDWSQNADFKTTVAVYSLRATGFVSMPVKWSELEKPRKLRWTPREALKRVAKSGDLFAPVLKVKQSLGMTPSTSRKRVAATSKKARALPKAGSQSGRRLFLVTKTETGNELWLDSRGRFQRFILRSDRTGGGKLIAMPAGTFEIEPAYYRAEVPARWKGRVTIDDSGAYEVIEGSWPRKHLELFFEGRVLSGRWLLEKIDPRESHRSWRLVPLGIED